MMSAIHIRLICTCLFAVGIIQVNYGQVIWSEDFSTYPARVTTGNNNNTANPAPDWTTTFNDCDDLALPDVYDNPLESYWGTQNGQFRVTDMEGLNCCAVGPDIGGTADNEWITEVIDIAGRGRIRFSVEAGETGDLEMGCNFACDNLADVIKVYYSLDGEAFRQACENNDLCGNFTNATVVQDHLIGETLQIRIWVGNKENDESHFFDNVIVEQSSTTPVAIAVSADTICVGGSANLEAPASIAGSAVLSYTWSPDDGNIDNANIADPVVSPPVTTTYRVRMETADGCLYFSDTTITVNPAPIADIPVDFQESCGMVTQLSATKSNGDGLWTALDGASVGLETLQNTLGAAPGPGTYRFVWTVSSPPCPADTDTIEVLFRNRPIARAGEDDSICGASAIIEATPTDFIPNVQGEWHTLSPDIVLQSASNPVTVATALRSGSYPVIWRETVDGICTDDDTVHLWFNVPVEIALLDTICNPTGDTYDILYRISGGFADQLETNGLPVGAGMYRIQDIPDGESVVIWARDPGICNHSDTVVVTHDCPCLTQAGQVVADTLTFCPGDLFSIPYDAQHVRDPNDTLLYLLATSPVPGPADVFYAIGLNAFLPGAQLIQPGTVYYGVVAVGTKNPSGGFGLQWTDPCLALSNAVPVRFLKPQQVAVSENITGCPDQPVDINLGGLQTGSYTVFYRFNGIPDQTVVSGPNPTLTYTLSAGKYYLELDRIVSNDDDQCITLRNTLVNIDIRQSPGLDFDFDSRLCVDEEILFLASPLTSVDSIHWDFGNGDGSNAVSPVTAYDTPGSYSVVVDIRDIYGCMHRFVLRDTVSVEAFPQPSFDVLGTDNDTLCFPDPIRLLRTTTGAGSGGYEWYLGSSLLGRNTDNITIQPNARGAYTVRLNELSENGCNGSAIRTIWVVGPRANLALPLDTVCYGDEVDLFYTSGSGIKSQEWVLSGHLRDTLLLPDPEIRVNGSETNKNLNVVLTLRGAAGCELTLNDNLFVSVTRAGFAVDQPDSTYCLGEDILVFDQSTGATDHFWKIDRFGFIDTVYVDTLRPDLPGTYDIRLLVRDSITGCSHETTGSFNVWRLPEIEAFSDTTCFDRSITLNATGAKTYEWIPETLVDSATSATPTWIQPAKQDTFTVIGTDEHGCTDTITYAPPVVSVPRPTQSRFDTLVARGDSILFVSWSDTLYSTRWKGGPATVCDTCSMWFYRAMEDGIVTRLAEDRFGCFQYMYTLNIHVQERYSLDVADAFTPNGDGINDVIFPDGLGIEHIELFEVYNRFGQLMFRGQGIVPAWDGTFEGKLQPADNYTYIVRAKMLDQHIREVQYGSFKLIR